jgi:hypothetical protein
MTQGRRQRRSSRRIRQTTGQTTKAVASACRNMIAEVNARLRRDVRALLENGGEQDTHQVHDGVPHQWWNWACCKFLSCPHTAEATLRARDNKTSTTENGARSGC